jgi:hypothetical protein
VNQHKELFGVTFNNTNRIFTDSVFLPVEGISSTQRDLSFIFSPFQNIKICQLIIWEPRPSLTWSGGKDAAQYKSTLKEEN